MQIKLNSCHLSFSLYGAAGLFWALTIDSFLLAIPATVRPSRRLDGVLDRLILLRSLSEHTSPGSRSAVFCVSTSDHMIGNLAQSCSFKLDLNWMLHSDYKYSTRHLHILNKL